MCTVVIEEEPVTLAGIAEDAPLTVTIAEEPTVIVTIQEECF